MKKIGIFILLLTICISTYITIRAYQYYAPPQLRNPYQIPSHHNHDDTLRIAFIGDSWAYLHKSHNCIISHIIEELIKHPVSIQSYGICGLTSKEIYESIYKDSCFKQFFQQRKYDYCLIFAGINDSYKKMSTHYYQKSMEGIIDFLLTNNIRPIILEIPDYNIKRSYDMQTISRKVLRRISIVINDTPMDCKQFFRDALDVLICKREYNNKVSIIRYKSWNNNYSNDIKQLYITDGLHLNENGYVKLDSVIAKEITSLETR